MTIDTIELPKIIIATHMIVYKKQHIVNNKFFGQFKIVVFIVYLQNQILFTKFWKF